MSIEDEVVMRDVTHAGIVVSDRISRDVSTHLDLEESLEASRYTSHPYTTQPKEWPPLVEVLDTWELPTVLIERYMLLVVKGLPYVEFFLRSAGHGHQWTTLYFFGVLTSENEDSQVWKGDSAGTYFCKPILLCLASPSGGPSFTVAWLIWKSKAPLKVLVLGLLI